MVHLCNKLFLRVYEMLGTVLSAEDRAVSRQQIPSLRQPVSFPWTGRNEPPPNECRINHTVSATVSAMETNKTDSTRGMRPW